MELRNHITYTRRDRVHSLYFTSFRLFRRLGLWNLPLTIFFTLIGIASLCGYFSGELQFSPAFLSRIFLYLGAMLTGVGGIFLFFTVLLFVEKTTVTASFLFTDEAIDAKFAMNNNESSVRVNYTDIHKAYEMKRYFYVFYNRMQCFFVVKSGFCDEKDILSLREKLSVELGARFIRY